VIVPDGVFADDGDGLGFAMPARTSNDVLAIRDRITRDVAKCLAREACSDDDDAPSTPDVLAQVQAEAAATWRAPTDGRDVVRR